MNTQLNDDATAAVTLLLQSGKTINEIAKFADLDGDAVTRVARRLDLEPATDAQRRAKELYASAEGLTYQAIAQKLAGEGFTADDGSPMHHLTVASWVRNHGWPWGGAADGDYAPERTSSSTKRSRYVLRMSKKLDAEINTDDAIAQAAEVAWSELSSDNTRVVQLALVRGAAAAGVTDLAAIKKRLLDDHGGDLRG